MSYPLVLASGSPRRRELLAQAGYRFEVQVSSVGESRRPDEDAIRQHHAALGVPCSDVHQVNTVA